MNQSAVKCLFDTNILISMMISPKSVPAQAFAKAVTPPYSVTICNYSMNELKRVVNLKFPNKTKDFALFVEILASVVEFVTIPKVEYKEEKYIRDPDDRPILRAAIFANVDIIITGDKDFLESDIVGPKMMSPSEFLNF